MNEPTIDEQIKYQKELGYKDNYRAAILASLERLRDMEKRLDSQPVPVEPAFVTKMRGLPRAPSFETEWKCLEYIDTLQSSLRRVTEERDIEAANGKHWAEAYRKWGETDATMKAYLAANERAEAAESELKRVTEELSNIRKEIGCSDDLPVTTWVQRIRSNLEAAESLNKRMVELLRDPSEGMVKALENCHEGKMYPQDMVHGPRQMRLTEFRAMSEQLLKEVGE